MYRQPKFVLVTQSEKVLNAGGQNHAHQASLQTVEGSP